MSYTSGVYHRIPTTEELTTNRSLGAAVSASRSLAEVKGRAGIIPNQDILIDTVALQEAKASSEIEQIVTTQDELFKAELFPSADKSGSAKEVERYRSVLKMGFARLRERNFTISHDVLIALNGHLLNYSAAFRDGTRTTIRNVATGEVAHTPPQTRNEVITLMDELEVYINNDTHEHPNPLIKMAVIHHRFENIHPFPDGNGRIGRILNVLYLTKTGLLDLPILYLSREINQTRSKYYNLLRKVESTGEWEDWIIYMLGVVEKSSIRTIKMIDGIQELMFEFKHRIRNDHRRIYSQDLLSSLFKHPYTKIEFVQRDLKINRQTASKYLDILAKAGLLVQHRYGIRKYYVNERLIELFISMENL